MAVGLKWWRAGSSNLVLPPKPLTFWLSVLFIRPPGTSWSHQLLCSPLASLLQILFCHTEQLTLFLTSSSSSTAPLCWPGVLVNLHFPLVPVPSLFHLSPSHVVCLFLASISSSISSGSLLAVLCSRYKSQSSPNIRVFVESCLNLSETIPDAAPYLHLGLHWHP